MRITIDTRERDLIEILESDSVEFKTCQLINGDILIEGNINILIERKRISDFYASIRDGRFSEQKERLKQTQVSHIMYIVEGIDFDDGRGSFAQNMLQKMIWTMALSEKIKILQVRDIHETALCIKHLSTKVDDSPISGENYYLPVSKKGLNTPRTVFMAMLRLIPNVSVAVANAITETYDTPFKLMNELENNPDNIANLEVQFTKSKRKIGNKLGESLKTHFFGCSY